MPVVLLGVFAALCWSVHDVLARSLAERIGPFRMAALVIIAGGVLLIGFVIYRGTVWTASPTGLLLAAGLGVAYGFGVAGLFKAFSLGPISLVAPLSATYPVLVFLWGVLTGLAPTPLQWTATVVALGGAVLVARSGGDGGGFRSVEKGKLPALFFFAAMSCVGYAVAFVLGQHAAVAIGEIEATWISRPAAMLAILPFMTGERRPAPLQLRHWNGIVLMAVFDVLAVIAVSASGHFPGREFAAIGISTYGASAVILAMIFLREKVSWGQWVGIVLIVVGVATLSVSQ